MITLKLNNNKGFILIASYMIIALLVVLATGFATRSISEQRVIHKEIDLMQALWLAEAGLDRAVFQLPDTGLSSQLGTGYYYTETSIISPARYLITCKGGVPDIDETDPNNIIRKIRAIVEQPLSGAGPSGITLAITANGDITVRGDAEVNGDIGDNAVFNFEEIFGISKEIMKENATNLYIDPENNVTPVTAATWVDIDSVDEMRLTDNGWEGSGILVVNGDLKITGGHFEGIIWVTGTLWVSGNPILDGAIYVESGAEFETTITGNPTVNYDAEDINNAFSYLPSGLPTQIISWKED